jgi:hypothetical protein
MADKNNVYDIGIGTGVDIDGLKKSLNEAEQEVVKSAAKQLESVEKAAYEQVRVIQKTEAEKVAEVKKGMQEQIDAVRATKGLSGADKQKEIQAIKEAENAKIKIIKDSAKLAETAIKESSKNQVKKIQDSTKKQLQALQDFSKKGIQALKDFARGAMGAVAGLDQALAAIASGPQSLGKLFVDSGKQIISTLNEWGRAATESMSIQDSLASVIKSTGASAWTTASQMNKLAADQSSATGRSRDEIAQMQSVLLGFRSVSKDVFKDASSAAIDMSKIMGGDLRGAANMLGKALDNPVTGMTALNRVGFDFGKQQKELAEQLIKNGDLLGAQHIVLDEVQKTFSGAATSTNATVQAQIAFNNAVTNFKIEIGTGWAQATAGMKQAFADFIQQWADATRHARELKAAIEVLRGANKGTIEYYDSSVAILTEFVAKNERHIESLKKDIEDAEKAGLFGQIIMSNASRDLHKQKINELEQENERARNRLKLDSELLQITKSIEESVKTTTEAESKVNSPTAIEAHNKALEARRKALQAINEKNAVLLRSMIAQAEAAAEIAKSELARFERQGVADKTIEENRKALDEQLKKDIRSAEIRNEITKQEADWLRAIIDARKEGEELTGLETKNIALQKQFIDANLQAYENLRVAAKDYLDLVDDETILKNLKAQWKAYQELEISENERKKRLADLLKDQKEMQAKITKILEDATGEKRVIQEENIQKQIADIRLKNAKEGIEAQAQYEIQKAEENRNRLRAEALNAMQEQLAIQKNLENAALLDAKGNEQLKSQIKTDGENERIRIIKQFNDTEQQLIQNTADREVQIEQEKTDAIKKLYAEMWQSALSKAQEFLNASQQIADGISTIWKNNINYQLESELAKNDKIIMSDEERARKEKELNMKAMAEKYKADMYQWSSNMIMSVGQGAMAVMNALTTVQPWPAAIAAAIVAGALSTVQQATIMSAQPKPPRFHSGGVVQGRAGQEVPAVLKTGEKVTTARQFNDITAAFANMANMKTGSGGVSMLQPIINNTVADQAQVNARFDGERLILDIVRKGLSDGSLDGGLATQAHNRGGKEFTSW